MKSDEEKNGGPAFPYQINDNTEFIKKGMTLRDHFAAKAMQGMVTAITRFRTDIGLEDIIVNRPNDISAIAYVYADAMLEARKQEF